MVIERRRKLKAAAGRAVEHMDYYSMFAELRMCVIGVRWFDRNVALEIAPNDPSAMIHTPFTRILAKRLGMPLPEISPAFFTMMKMVAGRKS